MGIHLLTVPGLGLEVRREGLTVHEPIAGNDTDGRALGEDVQKRSLFSSTVDFGVGVVD